MLQPSPSIQMREITASLASTADAVIDMPRRGVGIGLVADGEVGAFLRAAQRAVDVERVAIADALAEFAERGAYGHDGASGMTGWARAELGLSAREVRKLLRAHRTMRELAGVGASARSGEIGLDHVHVISGAVTRDGLDAIAAVEPVIVDYARENGPAELAAFLRELHDALTPEDLDDAYADGMDKHDIRVERVGNGADAGYAVTGWLDNVTGAKFRAWLDAASAPRPTTQLEDTDDAAGETHPAEDERTTAQRRVDAFGDLIDSALRHGMPHDRGVRPQMLITVDADTLLRAARAARDAAARDAAAPQGAWPMPPGPTSDRGAGHDTHTRAWWPYGPVPTGYPADLAGHGLIGPALLGMFACEADITAILVRDAGDQAVETADSSAAASLAQAGVLNVGRSHRLATPRQRRAVLYRQGGTCGNPSCTARHLDVHHVAWWDRDHGRTDLDNLVALCTRCHALVHTGQLIINPDGHGSFTFRSRRRPLPDTRRRLSRRMRRILRQALADPPME